MAKVQVVLLEDVAGQGRKGELITVSDGYAHNFLLKSKKGMLATPDALKKLEIQKEKENKRSEQEKEKALADKKTIESKKVIITVKLGDTGKMFGAVTNAEISSEIEKAFGLKVDKKKIDCNIKMLGLHDVPVKLHPEVKATLKIEIRGI